MSLNRISRSGKGFHPFCIKIIRNNKDFLDQSLGEIKLLRYLNEQESEIIKLTERHQEMQSRREELQGPRRRRRCPSA